MTRFLPIDRPLVYGDIVAFVTEGMPETADRNVYLTSVGHDEQSAILIELSAASGYRSDSHTPIMLPMRLLRLVVEE